MYSIWLDNSKISFIDICRNELLKNDYYKEDNIKKNPNFLYILNNLEKDSNDIFKEIEINDFIELHKIVLETPYSAQLEDEINRRLDILRFFLDSKVLTTEEAIAFLLDVEVILLDNLGLNPLLFLKFCFILFNLDLEGIESIFSRLGDLDVYISKKVQNIKGIRGLSKSEAINSYIFLLNKILLSGLIKNKKEDLDVIKNLHSLIEIIIEKEFIDYKLSEILSFYINLIKELEVDLNNLYSFFKLTIQRFFEELLITNRCSIDNLLEIWSILINLSIVKIKLNIETIIQKCDLQKQITPYLTDKIIFFEEYEKSKLPAKIIEFIDELELSFNNNCLRACQFFIRLIIETSLFIKAQINKQLNKFKNDRKEFIGLKEWPDIAFNLNFITKSLLPQVKDLIKYGDLGIHNFRVPTNREELIRNIEKLREIVYNVFFDVT